MEIGGYGFEKSELVTISEKLHEDRAKKQHLEIELSGEEFRRKYILRRENTSIVRIIANMPLVLLFLFEIFVLVFCLCSLEYFSSILIIVIGLVIVYTGKFGWQLLKEEFHMLVMFLYNNNPEKSMRIAKKYGIDTFQNDKIKCAKIISDLRNQIDTIDEEIAGLEYRQKELIDYAKNRDNILRKHNVLYDVMPEGNNSSVKNTLSLRKEDSADVIQLYEYYDAEEKYLEYINRNIQSEFDVVNKELLLIDEDIELVKNRVITYLCGIVIAIIIQIVVPNVISDYMGPVFLIVGLGTFLELERKSRGAIIRYLIEQESTLVSDYCFRNDVKPVKYRKQEIFERIKQNEAMIDDIKRKKQALEYN